MADDKTAAERAAEERYGLNGNGPVMRAFVAGAAWQAEQTVPPDRAKLWALVAGIIEPRWREDQVRGKRMDDIIARADAGTDAILAAWVSIDQVRAETLEAAATDMPWIGDMHDTTPRDWLRARATEYREALRG